MTQAEREDRGSRNDAAGGRREPVRQCVGCRERAPQRTLVRVVMSDSRVVADPGRRLPGRGAYVHRRMECLERAEKRGHLARALRAGKRTADQGALRMHFAALIAAANGGGVTAPTPVESRAGTEDGQFCGLTRTRPRFVVAPAQTKGQR